MGNSDIQSFKLFQQCWSRRLPDLEARFGPYLVDVPQHRTDDKAGLLEDGTATGEIAQARGIPLHVDACVGGFILPFMAMNGESLPP